MEVHCDWSTRKLRLVSADARGGGTRDESLRESAGEAVVIDGDQNPETKPGYEPCTVGAWDVLKWRINFVHF